jgi:predicted DNA-binding transcriptional regulator YafY
MENRKLISFTYYNKTGDKRTRSVEAYKLELDPSGNVVLWGFCLESKGIRKFLITSIADFKPLEDSFNPKWDIEDNLINWDCNCNDKT